jgi:hypothetical protein
MSVGPANRRRDMRRQLPTLTVEVAGIPYRTRDWSLGGFSVQARPGAPPPVDAEADCEGSFAVEGRPDSHGFRAMLMRHDRDTGIAGFRFVHLDGPGFTALERLLLRAEPPQPHTSWFARTVTGQGDGHGDST